MESALTWYAGADFLCVYGAEKSVGVLVFYTDLEYTFNKTS